MGLADLELLKEANMKLFLAVSSALRICAVLCAGTRIPRSVIAAAVQRMGLSEREVVAELCKHGLLVEDARTGAVTISAATQAEVLAGAGDADKLRVRAAALLNSVCPGWEEMRSSAIHLALAQVLVPHGVHVVNTCAVEGQDLANTAVWCANALQLMGRNAEAVPMHRRAVELSEAVLGADHTTVLRTRMVLGDVLARAGDYDEAAAELERLLKAMWLVLGADHALTLDCTAVYADVLRRQDDPRALEVATRVVAALRRVAGPRAQKTITAMEMLGLVQSEFGKLEEAEATQRKVLKAHTAMYGDGHSHMLQTLFNLGGTLHKLQRYAEAERVYRRVAEGRARALGRVHPDTNSAWLMLALDLFYLDRHDEARTILHRLERMDPETRGVRVKAEYVQEQLDRIAARELELASCQ